MSNIVFRLIIFSLLFNVSTGIMMEAIPGFVLGSTDTTVSGEGGVTYADLHMGNALPTYSEYGYGYAVEKAPTTKGWTYPVFEELWNYGFPPF